MSYIIITVVVLGGAYAIYKMIKKNNGKKIGKVSTDSFNFPDFDRARIENEIDLTVSEKPKRILKKHKLYMTTSEGKKDKLRENF